MTSTRTVQSARQIALAPGSKMDVKAVERLMPLVAMTLTPLVPHLLTWIQDGNWPVARPFTELLRKHSSIVVEPVREILRDEADEEDDGGWKRNCLCFLVAKMDRESKTLLKEDLVRIAVFPTNDEIEGETMGMAKDILGELEVTLSSEGKD